MPETTLRGGLNTYPTSVTGGSIPDDLRKEEFIRWANALDPWRTPIYTKLIRSKALDGDPVYFGQKGKVDLVANVNGALASGAVTLPVTTASGVNFQKYMVLEITDYH